MNIGDRNKKVVLSFFKALENGSAKTVASLFTEDGVQKNPYGSGLFPAGVQGTDAIIEYWAAPIENFESMSFDIEEIYAMEDLTIVFVKFKGDIVLKNNAGVYSNDYYATFRFNEEGKITEYVEIFNPIVAARGFGLIDQIK
jgi:ketosteroid isomerase-like protein